MTTTNGALLCLLLPLSDCGTATYIDLFTCEDPDLDHVFQGMPDPCHRRDCKPGIAQVEPCYDEESISIDGLTDPNECDGQCIPPTPEFWTGPTLVWFGPLNQVPQCPADITFPGQIRYGDPIPATTCTCDCAPAGEACALPSAFTASTAPCYQSGTSIPFDAPTPWDGSCMTSSPLPASVQSVTIAPLTLTPGICQPVTSSPPKPKEPQWTTAARICNWPLGKVCNKTPGLCAPDPPPPPAFFKCVLHVGEIGCPLGYTIQHTAYEDHSWVDDRPCSPCQCGGTPSGSRCTSQVSLDDDLSCGPTPPYAIMVSSDKAACFDITDGAPLRSKAASPPSYLPGMCADGLSVPEGEYNPKVEDSDIITICCLDETILPPE